jgi:hypothetical protein
MLDFLFCSILNFTLKYKFCLFANRWINEREKKLMFFFVKYIVQSETAELLLLQIFLRFLLCVFNKKNRLLSLNVTEKFNKTNNSIGQSFYSKQNETTRFFFLFDRSSIFVFTSFRLDIFCVLKNHPTFFNKKKSTNFQIFAIISNLKNRILQTAYIFFSK